MNIERINKAIELMQQAKNLDMREFQKGDAEPVKTMEELHACGNTACFAGYIALSPDFHAAGGWCDDGMPRMHNPHWGRGTEGYVSHHLCGSEAIAYYLGISEGDACEIVYGDLDEDVGDGNEWSLFYDKPWEEVTASDVIEKLEELRGTR